MFNDLGVGSFTFRDQSVMDYAIATAKSFENIISFEIYHMVAILSDGHSALHIGLNIPTHFKTTHEVTLKVPTKPPWKSMYCRALC